MQTHNTIGSKLIDMVIGVDPDADKNGVAVFINGELTCLNTLDTLDFYFFIENFAYDKRFRKILVSIEDVKSKGATFSATNRKGGQKVMNRISQNVGQCKHAQTEIERCCKRLNVDIVHYPPSSMFKKGAQVKLFKERTGFKGRCNEDERSAAHFGLIAIAHNRHKK
jgi:hypothetical protein